MMRADPTVGAVLGSALTLFERNLSMQSITHLAHKSKNHSQILTGTLPVRAFHPDRFFGTLHIDGQQPRVAAMVCHHLDLVAVSLVGYDTSVGAALANLWNKVAVPFLVPQDIDWKGPRKLERRAEGYKQFTTRLEGTKEVHAIALPLSA